MVYWTDRFFSYAPDDLADVLLLSAKLYRKAGDHRQSFKATLQATAYGAPSATIEQARLLWAQQHQRKAIQTLESAIVVGAFSRRDSVTASEMMETDQQQQQQNILVAKAKLLLTKWLDSSGQLASVDLVERYREASSTFTRWEKGHYALGRYYNKLLEADKAAPLVKQSQPYHSGETVKLIIKAYLKALTFGVKYVSQTLPKLLTLWLDLGQQCHDSLPLDPKVYTIEYSNRVLGLKLVQLSEIHKAMQQALAGRVPAYVLYTAFPQMIARICHPTERVHELLESLIVRVVSSHPQQALWALMAVVKSSSRDRASRGTRILDRVRESDKGTKAVPGSIDIRSIVAQAKRLSEILLQASETDIPAKVSQVSLAHHLKVSFKSQRGIMVIPIEATLIPVLPTESENMRIHKAFSKDAVTIEGFKDEVTVLSSLQRPRKLTVRGSDGKAYGLLCKPKDDLRKDQRLMEFNTIINRALRKDAESSQRRLYIKTYAVTPLNEECGVIEWVDGLRTLRDILLSLYRAKGVQPNYQELRGILDEICATPAKNSLFQEKVLARFPPVLHEWFTTTFAEPSTWFTARLRYTRSAAVMSMIGHVLGLGDRHGENILFEEGNGGTFHVDFNCLFDKGLTFDKPERVPFRLTHNMVDAFGIYRHEGPFRKSCELTIKLLRANEDTLMTILETFVYDPTTDFIGKKKRRPDASVRGVVETPQDILDQVQTKVRGIMRGEVIPLGVEGQVQELIRQATDVTNLVNMYIGWCAFF